MNDPNSMDKTVCMARIRLGPVNFFLTLNLTSLAFKFKEHMK